MPKDLDDHTVMGFDPQFGFFQVSKNRFVGLPEVDQAVGTINIIKGHQEASLTGTLLLNWPLQI